MTAKINKVTRLRNELAYPLTVGPVGVFRQITSRSQYIKVCDGFRFSMEHFEFIKQGVLSGYHKTVDKRIPGGGGIFLGQAQCNCCGALQTVSLSNISIAINSRNYSGIEVVWKCFGNRCSTIRGGTSSGALSIPSWGKNSTNFPPSGPQKLAETEEYYTDICNKDSYEHTVYTSTPKTSSRSIYVPSSQDDWTLEQAIEHIDQEKRDQEIKDKWWR